MKLQGSSVAERLIGAQVVRKTDFLDVLQKVIVEMVAVGIITGERSSSLKQFTLFFNILYLLCQRVCSQVVL